MRPEDLYIKMNSRGKPLTEFENFKAHFEQTIQWSSRPAEFALRVDTRWSDLLWRLPGDDDLIDDEFMRYIGVHHRDLRMARRYALTAPVNAPRCPHERRLRRREP